MTYKPQTWEFGFISPDPVFLFGVVVLTPASQTSEGPLSHPKPGSHIAQAKCPETSLPQPPESWHDVITGVHLHLRV